jgi:voltage-gated potassium channel
MKFFPAQFAYYLQNRTARRNLQSLRRYFAVLGGMVALYSVAFHFIMAAEGQRHSWLTGFYWTLTVMSTLGFGDITFQSDLGRLFSMLVLLSGVIFLLIVLPFAFIQLFYAPWLETQSSLRAPRALPEGTSGHVILSHYDPVAISLAQRLAYYGRPYVVLEPDVKRALDLHDAGVQVMVGERDDVESYRALRAEDAALLVATGDDYVNTNVAFTAREVAPRVPIVSLARSVDSVDILHLAGASHVLHLPEMLGQALARRTLGGYERASVVGRFGDLLIAEAPMTGSPLVGKRLSESRLRAATGLTVVGIWERGVFRIPDPEDLITSTTVLVMAGSEEQLARFSELMVIYEVPEAPVVIIGGGRVGRAVARALAEREVEYRIVEHDPTQVRDPERNVSTLHRAGADFVMSYASMGANAIYNVMEKGDIVMLAEGLDVFRHPVPASLAGRTLAEMGIRGATGCSVVAVETDGETAINPPPDARIAPGAELILIGTTEAERRFVERFG